MVSKIPFTFRNAVTQAQALGVDRLGSKPRTSKHELDKLEQAVSPPYTIT